MSIWVTSQEPSALLAALEKAIDEGVVRNWAYDEKGDLYPTARPRLADFRERGLVADARFHPEIEADGVWLTLVPCEGESLGEWGFSWHNSQLLIVFLEHFPELCPGLEISLNELEEAAEPMDRPEGSGWTMPRAEG